jgi:hypothetical protein
MEAWEHLNQAQQDYAKELWPQGAARPDLIERQHADAALQIMATIKAQYPEGRASYDQQEAERKAAEAAPDPT